MKNEVFRDGNEIPITASQAITVNTVAAGLPLSGEAAMVGDIAGVMASTPALATDLVTLKTKGVFNLSVTGNNGSAAAIAAGASVYFDTATGTLNSNAAKKLYGYTLDPVSSGATTLVRVKLKH